MFSMHTWMWDLTFPVIILLKAAGQARFSRKETLRNHRACNQNHRQHSNPTLLPKQSGSKKKGRVHHQPFTPHTPLLLAAPIRLLLQSTKENFPKLFHSLWNIHFKQGRVDFLLCTPTLIDFWINLPFNTILCESFMAACFYVVCEPQTYGNFL